MESLHLCGDCCPIRLRAWRSSFDPLLNDNIRRRRAGCRRSGQRTEPRTRSSTGTRSAPVPIEAMTRFDESAARPTTHRLASLATPRCGCPRRRAQRAPNHSTIRQVAPPRTLRDPLKNVRHPIDSHPLVAALTRSATRTRLCGRTSRRGGALRCRVYAVRRRPGARFRAVVAPCESFTVMSRRWCDPVS